MRYRFISQSLGQLLQGFSIAPLFPLFFTIFYLDFQTIGGFVITSAASFILGWLFRKLGEGALNEVSRVEGAAIVALAWFFVAALGSIPYIWTGMTPLNALFESMSGFTTTGSTIITDFSAYSETIYIWRGMTQWLGGMGIIVLFIAILPALAIAGRQMFFAESPGPTEDKLAPRIRFTAIALYKFYIGLTIAEIIALMIAGYPFYDALCNSFTTMSAGGFSPNPESIAGYNNPAAQWIITIFMFIAGANYMLQYRAIKESPVKIIKDPEFKLYTGIVIVASILIFVSLALFDAGYGFDIDTYGHSIFQTLTIITTTGFASVDFENWSDAAKMALVVLMAVGGCSGSAGGGVKVVRYLVIFQFLKAALVKTRHPDAVISLRMGNTVISNEIVRQIVSFFLFYFLILIFCGGLIAVLENDLIVGMTGAAVTLGNIGPGFGKIGPMANFEYWQPASKVVGIIAMWIGRLEIMTVLMLLAPGVWKPTPSKKKI